MSSDKTTKWPAPEKVRELIKAWVSLHNAKSNLRHKELLKPSIYTNRKVFDDYGKGLKLFFTTVSKVDSKEQIKTDDASTYKTEDQLLDQDNTSDVYEYPFTPCGTDFQFEVEESSKSSVDMEDFGRSLEQPKFWIDFDTTPFDQDVYDQKFRQGVRNILRNPTYKSFFNT